VRNEHCRRRLLGHFQDARTGKRQKGSETTHTRAGTIEWSPRIFTWGNSDPPRRCGRRCRVLGQAVGWFVGIPEDRLGMSTSGFE
jgi:hypothetical protein